MLDIKLNQLTPATRKVYDSLVANVESTYLDDKKQKWGSVYLDNAQLPGMTHNQFAGHLGWLKQVNLYKTYEDHYFGDVRIG